MNLVNEEITHKVFGKGNVIEQESPFITIDFDGDVKKFIYPDAFKTFITLNNEDKAKSLNKIIIKLKAKEEAREAERKIQKEQERIERERLEKVKNYNIHESSQIVFWLDEEEQKAVFNEWLVSTGKIQSGNNKGQPNRVARLRPNSAAVLTVRDEDQDETERRIIGLYMVNETYTGSNNDKGYVPSHDEFQVELTEEESEKMLFWNYYVNRNYPHRMTWNSGKYRYFDNIWTAQILSDLINLRTDEEEKKALQEFLNYFCDVNAIDIKNIPELEGALKQA